MSEKRTKRFFKIFCTRNLLRIFHDTRENRVTSEKSKSRFDIMVSEVTHEKKTEVETGSNFRRASSTQSTSAGGKRKAPGRDDSRGTGRRGEVQPRNPRIHGWDQFADSKVGVS
ncbi:MAG: hypothetical protein ACRCV5_06340 [Afipia sp.]